MGGFHSMASRKLMAWRTGPNTVASSIEAAELTAKRREAEHDYFYCLKNYSAKHDMPLETPSRTSIERKLHALGFEFEGVSTRYVLEFVPHPDDFGGDTLALEEFEAARRVLNTVRLMSLAESLGGVETLISHPATMTHASVPADHRVALGITDGFGVP